MIEPSPPPGEIVLDEVVQPRRPWGHRVAKGDILRLIDLEGQQAVDFLCYDAEDPTDRYCATNTVKVQGKLFVDKGTVLYSDLGNALFSVVEYGSPDISGPECTFYRRPRFDNRQPYRAGGAEAEATAQSERTRPWLLANR